MNPVATAVFRHMVSKVGDDMSDTLKSDLNVVISALLEAGLGLKSTHVAAVEKAIAELDRLEAEVKKPRLPDGYSVEPHSYLNDNAPYYNLWLTGKDVAGVIARHRSDDAMGAFLSAFLTTPDVVPSTEPVHAAGEHWLVFFEDAEVRPEIFDDETAARVRYEACLRNWNCHLFRQVSPAEVPNQDKGYQTPMNTEKAEKPKPVSLADEVHRTKPRWAHGGVVHENEFYHALDVIDARLRTLDQERGV